MFNSVSRKSVTPCKHLFYTKTQFMEQHISKSGPESVSSSHLLIVKCSLFIDSLIYSGVCLTESPFQDFTPKGNNLKKKTQELNLRLHNAIRKRLNKLGLFGRVARRTLPNS